MSPELAVIIAGFAAALSLIAIILTAANWRTPPMAKSPTAVQLLADIATLSTNVESLIAKAAATPTDDSGEADLQVAGALAPVLARVDTALNPPAPEPAPVEEAPAPVAEVDPNAPAPAE